MESVTASKYNQLFLKLFGSLPSSMNKINTGLSGAQIYSVNCQDNSYILRVANQDIASAASLENEYQLIQQMSEHNIAPKLYYSDAKDGVLIMDSISAHGYSFSDENILKKLADKLKQLHNLQIDVEITTCSLGDYVSYSDNIVNNITAQQELPEYISKFRTCIDMVKENLNIDWQYKPCHLDINPSNIIYDGSDFVLLDWDSMRASDPMLDLVSFMNFFCHDPSLAQKFLGYYYGEENITTKITKRLFFLTQINLYFYGMMFLNLASKDNALIIADVKINDLSTPLDFFKRLSTGQENLATSLSQARVGLCMLRYAYSKLNLEIQIHGTSVS